MTERITVVFNDKIVQKLRELQGNSIVKTKSSVSFSSVVNQELSKHLKVTLK